VREVDLQHRQPEERRLEQCLLVDALQARRRLEVLLLRVLERVAERDRVAGVPEPQLV
jgi:hypothetical protein